MIERIEYENYLVLKDVAIDFERFTVIVGPNSCGKSTVLDSTQISPHQQLEACRSAGTTGAVSLRATRKGTLWRWPPGGPYSPLLAGSRVLRLSASALRAPAAHVVPNQRINPDGSLLGSTLADIALDDRERIDRISAHLQRVVPAARTVSAVRSQGPATTYEPAIHFADIGRVPAERISEGTLFALAIIVELSATNRSPCILIDDIDKGLHPAAQAELVRLLREFLAADPDLQIIVTTHSPYLLDQFEIEEVRVMTLGDDGFARCRPLAAHPDVEKWRTALRAGEIWSTVGEDWIREPAEG